MKYRVDRREIGFLRFVFEACEGIAVVTTDDPVAGRITLRVAPGCQDEVNTVLSGLAGEILMEAENGSGANQGA